MSDRQALLRIDVADSQGHIRAPGPNDKVVLKDRLSLQQVPLRQGWSEDKGFTFALESADIELSVQYEGFAELRQWFRVAGLSGETRLYPFWPGTDKDPAAGGMRDGYILECIRFTHAVRSSPGTNPMCTITVTLPSTREYVAVIGTDYWEGALSGSHPPARASLPFPEYAVTFGNHLDASGLVSPASPWTMLDCQRGLTEVWMRARGKGWRRQLVRPDKKKPAPAWNTPQQFIAWIKALIAGKESASDYLGAPDIYAYLSEIGTVRPGTVAEFSIFSHAWAGGPILFNTLSLRGTTRSSSDLDMRMIDFLPENSSAWKKLPDAFAPPAASHLWGCFATTLYLKMVDYLNRTKPDTEQRFEYSEGPISAAFTRPEVIRLLTDTIDRNCYMKMLAMYTKRPVYGAPPGYGSEWTSYGRLPQIPAALKQVVQGAIMHIPATSRPGTKVRALYESEAMGSRSFDEFGLMRYTP